MEPKHSLFDYAASPYGGRHSSSHSSASDSHSDLEHPGPVTEFVDTPSEPFTNTHGMFATTDEHVGASDGGLEDSEIADLVNLYSDDDATSTKPGKVYDLSGTSDTPPPLFSDSSESTTIDSTGGFRDDDDVHDFGDPLPRRTYGRRVVQSQHSRRSNRSVWTKSRPHVSTFDTLATSSIQDDLEKRRQLESLFDGKLDESGGEASPPYDYHTTSVPEVVPGGGPMPSVRFNGSRYVGFGSDSMPHGGAGAGGGGGAGGGDVPGWSPPDTSSMFPGSYGTGTSGPYQHSQFQSTPSYSYNPPVSRAMYRSSTSDSDSDASDDDDVSSMESLSVTSDDSDDQNVEQADIAMMKTLGDVGPLMSEHYSKSTAIKHVRSQKTPKILEYRLVLQRTIQRKKKRAQRLLEITRELERALKKHHKKFNKYIIELNKYRSSMRQTKFAPFDESWLDLTKPPQTEANDWFWTPVMSD